jgi:hypothetical protein
VSRPSRPDVGWRSCCSLHRGQQCARNCLSKNVITHVFFDVIGPVRSLVTHVANDRFQPLCGRTIQALHEPCCRCGNLRPPHTKRTLVTGLPNSVMLQIAQAAAMRTALAKGFVQRVHSRQKLAAIGGNSGSISMRAGRSLQEERAIFIRAYSRGRVLRSAA